MTHANPLPLEKAGVSELLREYGALRTWEAIRCARSVVTVQELCESTGLEPRLLQRHVDLLMQHGLLLRVRARKPRPAVGYRVAMDRIIVTFDEGKPDSVAMAMDSSESVGREFARCVDHFADPEFQSKAGFRFRHQSMQHFTQEDLAELRRRMLSVIEFLAMPRPGRPQSKQPGGTRSSIRAYCNQAISIRLDPLVGDLLPLPSVWMTPRSKLSGVAGDQADRTGLRGLAPREREVAFALADGLSRTHVAERMGLSVNTVSTLARRIYRKLGVSSQAALAARLAGHARRRLGER